MHMQDRIAALELQSKRLKSQLAANAGEEYLLDLLLDDKMKDLPERLQSVHVSPRGSKHWTLMLTFIQKL
jgi:hypothetical protein